MRELVLTIDSVLRGKLTRKEDLAAGRIDVPVLRLVAAGVLLGVVYGLCMGLFAVMREGNPSTAQLLATTVKVPLLFLLTLIVTYPSLYVVSALFDSRLRSAQTMRLLLTAVCVNLALLASLGPVTVFFTLSTDSYPFMVLLNVLFMGISGLAGLAFLRRALDAVFSIPVSGGVPRPAPPGAETGQKSAAVAAWRPVTPPSRRIFTFWILIYGVVGAQMGWILRPFIGSPGLEFQFFRERGSNFFAAVIEALQKLLS
ncbi:MAG: hypothetical protein H6831_08070 [Planctomycetes bacterium]|nr:hypothetical protein [Planctomycetota bacterium]MCB9904347.1 hypothetical protein [Planctomycetota bacterium]